MTDLNLTFAEIDDCLPDGITALDDGSLRLSAQMLHDFAHNVTRKLRTTMAATPAPGAGPAHDYRFSDLARRYGGSFHGPHIEHLSMPETAFHHMMREFEQTARPPLPHPSILIQPEHIQFSAPIREFPKKLERSAQRMADNLREAYPAAPAGASVTATPPRVIARDKLPDVTHF